MDSAEYLKVTGWRFFYAIVITTIIVCGVGSEISLAFNNKPYEEGIKFSVRVGLKDNGGKKELVDCRSLTTPYPRNSSAGQAWIYGCEVKQNILFERYILRRERQN